MKWIKFLVCLLVPMGLAFSIYTINFESVFGKRQTNTQQTLDEEITNDDEVEDKVIKFEIGYGIDIINTNIIPPEEVMFQESFVTANDVVDFYNEYNIAKNFYFDKRQTIDVDSEEKIIIKLIPTKSEDVKRLNRFDHSKVNINYFLDAGLTLEESISLEQLCWDVKVKDINEIKYRSFEFLNPNYRKEFLDYAIEKMIY